jgi:hypothetical protein
MYPLVLFVTLNVYVPLRLFQWHTQEFFFFWGGGGLSQECLEGIQQIQLKTEGRENLDLDAVAPYSGVPLFLQMSETHIPIRLLWMYFP